MNENEIINVAVNGSPKRVKTNKWFVQGTIEKKMNGEKWKSEIKWWNKKYFVAQSTKILTKSNKL